MPGFVHVEPPATARGDVVEHFHGTAVADPYRWLEDLGTPEVAGWVAAQNAHTERVLAASPWRAALRTRLAALQQIERRTPVACVRGRLYTWRQRGDQAQPVLWEEAAQPGADGEPARVVLDANTLCADGSVAVAEVAVSPDGRWLAYAIADGGSDWLRWQVRCLTTLLDEADQLEHGRFSSAAWLRDSSGFVYGRYPAPAADPHAPLSGHALWLHRLGQAQCDDVLLYQRPDRPRWVFGPRITRCGRWLIVSIWDGSPNRRLHRVDLNDPARAWSAVLDDADAAYTWVASTEVGELLLLTDALGGTGAVVAINPDRPQRAAWRTLVAPGAERLESAVLVGRQLVLCTLQDGASRLQRVPLEGGAPEVLPLPALGTASGFVAEDVAAGEGDAPLHFSFSSFTVAPTLMRLDAGAAVPVVHFAPALPFDASRFETVLAWCKSADGTPVPMHITRRRGLGLDGRSPCLLVGYGGFGISQRPAFVASRIAWLEMGGVLVQAMLRGGGEYGRAWHEAARLVNKPRTFDDYLAAAEHLVASGHTQPSRLVAHGGSNGGLTVAASVLARPELFGALVPAVPMLDMLRYHRFGIGAAWAADYGRADDADHPEHFATLLAYSPLHRVSGLRPGHPFPPTLLLTAERDDRVHPAHAFKFTAALQHAALGVPVLLRTARRAGHGAGKSAAADADEKADLYTFLALALELPFNAVVEPEALP